MSANKKIDTKSSTNTLKSIINRLTASVTTSKNDRILNTELDYYHRYVYPTKLEDKVEAVIRER